MGPTYPLQGLAELRKREVAECKRDLADAITSEEQRSNEVESLAAACDGKAEELQHYRLRHEVATVRAEALVRRDKYAERLEQERQILLERHRSARARLREQREAVERARGELALARAECRATEKHREQWVRRMHQHGERRAEDDTDDLLRASEFTDRGENQ